MHLPKDENYEDARLTMLCMFTDLKHSKPWKCEFCGALPICVRLRSKHKRSDLALAPTGAPARETQMQTVPYVFFPICRLPVYVRSISPLSKCYRHKLTAIE